MDSTKSLKQMHMEQARFLRLQAEQRRAYDDWLRLQTGLTPYEEGDWKRPVASWCPSELPDYSAADYIWLTLTRPELSHEQKMARCRPVPFDCSEPSRRSLKGLKGKKEAKPEPLSELWLACEGYEESQQAKEVQAEKDQVKRGKLDQDEIASEEVKIFTDGIEAIAEYGGRKRKLDMDDYPLMNDQEPIKRPRLNKTTAPTINKAEDKPVHKRRRSWDMECETGVVDDRGSERMIKRRKSAENCCSQSTCLNVYGGKAADYETEMYDDVEMIEVDADQFEEVQVQMAILASVEAY